MTLLLQDICFVQTHYSIPTSMWSFVTILFLLSSASALNTGVGKLPVMGYDTWNAFGCDYNGPIATEQARIMNESGLVGLGYNTVRT